MLLKNKEEALQFVDTEVRKNWQEYYNKIKPEYSLGEARIIDEKTVEGHTVWQYHIQGLEISRDNRKRWLIDNGRVFDTTLSEDENTVEKAYQKSNMRHAAFIKAERLLKTSVMCADVDGVGFRFWTKDRGGGSLILGFDGGVLFAISSVSPGELIQMYKDGKRTDESLFDNPKK